MEPGSQHFCKIAFILVFSNSLILVSCSPLNFSLAQQGPSLVGALFQKPEVFLTVSSISAYKEENNKTILLDRKLILNWHSLNISSEGSFVGLFNKDPSSIPSKQLKIEALHIVSVMTSKGEATTSTRYTRQNLTWNSEKCSRYWIAHFKENVLQSNCLKIHPTWMHDIKESIQNRPIHSIMIPGSHNAGAWRHFEGESSDNILERYLICHDDSVYEQLIHGIRYLDIRVGFYPETKEQFFINHDQFRVRPLIGILMDVRKFVLETSEIVFLDFHRFPTGFNKTVHKLLIKTLENVLEPLLAPKSLTKNAKLADFWKINKTIIVGYDEENSEGNAFLWSNVQQEWADTNKVYALERFLNNSIQRHGCKGDLWANLGQLTFTLEDILARPDFGIRGFANLSNPKITEWYRRKEWHSRSMIVATDYYLGSNIVEISLEVNKNGVICK